MNYVTTIKILVIGQSGVGKTSITRAFTSGDYESKFQPTIGVDFRSKVIKVDDVTVKLGIWDTAGMERFRAVTSSIYRNVHGAIFVYDISDPMSLASLNGWIEELHTYATKENIVCLVVGNKKDKARAVTREQGQAFAQKHRMLFIESSAKTQEGINLAFEELTQKIIETPGLWQTDELTNICISSEDRRKQKKSSCLDLFDDCFK